MWRKLLKNPTTIVGIMLVLAALAVGLLGAHMAPADPVKLSIGERLRPPSYEHLFGTDHFGRDVLSRVLVGARDSLATAGAASLAAFVVGGAVGLLSGYMGGRVDLWAMRCMDVLLAFPSLLLAIAVSAALGQGARSIILALAVVYLPRTARLGRSLTLAVREQDFVTAAEAAGASHGRILLRHITPNILSPVVVQLGIYFSEMILAEAALSFLGLGTPPPTPTWGNVLADGKEFLIQAPWISIFPGLFIAGTVLGLNLLGDGMRDLLDPRT